jgi:hypothetical protein
VPHCACEGSAWRVEEEEDQALSAQVEAGEPAEGRRSERKRRREKEKKKRKKEKQRKGNRKNKNKERKIEKGFRKLGDILGKLGERGRMTGVSKENK